MILLTLINLLNYLDRYLVASLVETIKKSELALTDSQAGLLMTGFILVYMIASPIFGYLGDRARRTRLVAAGVLLWSLATSAGGLARGFLGLFASRAAVGVGEAAYGAIGPAMIADLYAPERRSRAYAVFFSAIPVGSALGYVAGGLLGARWGWRWAFLIGGVPGALLAGLLFFMKDPPRGAKDVSNSKGEAFWKNPAYLMAVAGYAAYTFALGGLAFWMPAFLERVRGLSRESASVNFGAIVVVTGFIGTFVGGWVADRLRVRRASADWWVCALSTWVGVPLVGIALRSPDPSVYWSAMTAAELALFFSTGPINSVIARNSSALSRAAAVGTCNFAIHFFGDVPSPALIGWLSDRGGLESAIQLIPAGFAVAAAVWMIGAVKRWS